MAIYTKSYFSGLSSRSSFTGKQSLITESRKLNYFDIFLSHSYLDRDVVEGIFIELRNIGYSVYVDWIIDPHLDRKNVTKESAELIRLRMNNSRSLILAVSTNAQTSKWMPWELGYMDAKTKKCSVLPISESDNASESYSGFEYLKLYPFIKKGNVGGISNLWAIENANKYIALNEMIYLDKHPESRAIKIY